MHVERPLGSSSDCKKLLMSFVRLVGSATPKGEQRIFCFMNKVFSELKIDITYRLEFDNVLVMVWFDDTLIAEGIYNSISEVPSIKEILRESQMKP